MVKKKTTKKWTIQPANPKKIGGHIFTPTRCYDTRREAEAKKKLKRKTALYVRIIPLRGANKMKYCVYVSGVLEEYPYEYYRRNPEKKKPACYA